MQLAVVGAVVCLQPAEVEVGGLPEQRVYLRRVPDNTVSSQESLCRQWIAGYFNSHSTVAMVVTALMLESYEQAP